MSDLIHGDAAHEWQQRCHAACFELDPIKLLERVAEARKLVVSRIENSSSRPSYKEAYALQSALETLNTLRELAERELGKQKTIVQSQHSTEEYVRYNNRQTSG